MANKNSSVRFFRAHEPTAPRSTHTVSVYDTLALYRLGEAVCWDERVGVGKST